MVPAQGQFEHEHSKKWSAAIAPFDGYIFVSPEYNYGLPGGVKNAIDYLYNELAGKPVLIVTYGIKGGSISSESLERTFTGMKTRVVETRPQLSYAGPGMAEMFAATGTGKLGPNTIELWEKEGKEPLLKGFEQLVTLLETPVPEPAKSE
jgi:NAD(P)H-dependent FMN reductase